MTMAERIQEGLNLVRRFVDTPYEAAALAYLTEQVEIAKRDPRNPALSTMLTASAGPSQSTRLAWRSAPPEL
jgi:hypothetical protein